MNAAQSFLNHGVMEGLGFVQSVDHISVQSEV